MPNAAEDNLVQLIRSLLYYGVLILSALLWGVVILSLAPLLPFSGRYTLSKYWQTFQLGAIRVICGLEYRVEGAEHLRPGPMVILAKHEATYETFVLPTIMPTPLIWVLKRELLRIPFFGWGLATTDPIAINRGDARQALKEVIAQGLDRLAQGRAVLIFPQGTRILPGQSGKYAGSGSLLAHKAGVPVLPIAHNAGDYWVRHRLIIRPGTVCFRIGPVIDSKELSSAEINRRAEAWIESAVQEIRSNHPPT